MSGGGGKGGSTTQTTDQTSVNFAPFQSEAIGRVFDILGGGAGEELLLGGTGRDSLLQVPEQASSALSGGLNFANRLLELGTPGQVQTREIIDRIIDERSQDPFADTIRDLRGLGRDALAQFGGLSDDIRGLAGIDDRAGGLLLETARRDPASNPFVDALVGDVSTDVENAVLDRFVSSGTGGLEASAAPQAIAREVGRASNQIRSAAFESEANRALTAQQALGQFDAAAASQELNQLLGASNVLSQGFGINLSALNSIGNLDQAEVARRQALINARLAAANGLTSSSLAGLNAVGPLAQSFTELPFVPLSNFSSIAFSPLGSQTTGTVEQEQDAGLLGTLGSIANLGLTAAGIGSTAGLFGPAAAGAGGLPAFGSSLGPLAASLAPPPPVGTSLLGSGSNIFAAPGAFFSGGPF